MNWISVVSLIGAAQGCFIAYLVLAHGRQKAANLWLGLYVSAYAALCLGDALSHSSLVPKYPDVTTLFDFCIFLLGPFLYQYVRVLTGRGRLGKKLWVHLVPAILALLLVIAFHLLPINVKREALAADLARPHKQADPFLLLAALQIFAYLAACLWLLRDHAQRLKQNYSSLEKRSFLWLRNLLLVNCVLWFIWLVAVVLHNPVAIALDYLGFPLAAYVLAAFAMRAPEVLMEFPVADEPAAGTPILTEAAEVQRETTPPGTDPAHDDREKMAVEKYQKSRLPTAILDRYENKLARLMVEEKPHLDNELTLPQLARRLAIPGHHLSQLLNERLGMNFFDYVNGLRVEEVKRLLRDANRANQSILDLAFQAGFSSKSSFNSFFKRVTGYSPTAYRKLHPSSSMTQEGQTSTPIGPDDARGASL